jgi:hypothetical protein
MPAIKILFVGNSHTYLHYMPEMVAKLGEAGGHAFDVRQVTGEGASLKWHWQNPATRDLIGKQKWDYVILQERSEGSLENRVAMSAFASRLHKEIKMQGSKTVLFMTWANRAHPETQQAIANAYSQLSRDLGAILAPVGLAWEKAKKQEPGFDLHHKDGRHANPVGSYLTACVFYAVFTGKSPMGLPETLFVAGKQRVNLSRRKAIFLQETAAAVAWSQQLC